MGTVPGISAGWAGSLRMLGQHQSTIRTALERLGTGRQINRASDDPSGLVAAEGFKARQAEIDSLIDGFGRENARLGATEGGLSVIQDMLTELQGLVVERANTGGLGEGEGAAIDTQIRGLLDGINQTVQTATFNGEQVLLGNFTGQLGRVIVDGGMVNLDGLPELLGKDPEKAQSLVESAIESVSGKRAAIGARMRSIDAEMGALREEFANNAGVLGRIEDADVAAESAELVRAQILEKAAIEVIRIERESATRVLDLLAGVGPRA